MNLLLVEDEPNVVSVIKRGLTEEGFKTASNLYNQQTNDDE